MGTEDGLEVAAFWVSERIDHGFIHSLYSYDPHGIPIEFNHNVRGVDGQAHPKMATQHHRLSRKKDLNRALANATRGKADTPKHA